MQFWYQKILPLGLKKMLLGLKITILILSDNLKKKALNNTNKIKINNYD